MTLQQRAALARAMIIISRYRAETPLGHQPYMLAGQADEALHELNRALGAPTEQEPVVFLKEWSDWRYMVVGNLMRHGSIDKHLARELANHFQSMTPQPKEPAIIGNYLEKDKEQEPVAWESLLGAVARGWCYEENANKTMDSDLAVAIAKEVQALYTTPPQRKPLTKDQMYSAIRPLFKTDALAEAALSITFAEYRAIEAAHNIKE